MHTHLPEYVAGTGRDGESYFRGELRLIMFAVEVFKSGKLFEKSQPNQTRWSVPLFRDNQFRNAVRVIALFIL